MANWNIGDVRQGMWAQQYRLFNGTPFIQLYKVILEKKDVDEMIAWLQKTKATLWPEVTTISEASKSR